MLLWLLGHRPCNSGEASKRTGQLKQTEMANPTTCMDCLQLAITIHIVIIVAVIVATELTQCNWHPIIVDADHSCRTSNAASVSGSGIPSMIDDMTQPDNMCVLRRAHSIHFGGRSNSPSTFNSLGLNDYHHCHHNYHMCTVFWIKMSATLIPIVLTRNKMTFH
jgi:hypothetical protein